MKEEEKEEFIKSVEDLLTLIDEGVLVRDISRDDDFSYYVQQGLRITQVLSAIQRNLEVAKK